MPHGDNDNDDRTPRAARAANQRKGVRFASEPIVHHTLSSGKRSHDDDADDPLMDQAQAMHQERLRRKRPRVERPNDDNGGADMAAVDSDGDDDDDIAVDDDDDDDDDNDPMMENSDEKGPLPSERELLRAKERRRQQREAGHDDSDDYPERTSIDRTTSLAAEEGVAFEPFNMAQEQSDGTGYFDGDTYVFRKRAGDDDEPDAWLDSLQQQDGSSAVYTRNKDDSESSETDESSVVKMDDMSKNDLYACIIPLVSDSETIMQAIIRYGNLVKRKPGGGGGKQNTDPTQSQATQAAQQSLNSLTEAASALLLQGQVDIYQMTRNQLLAVSGTNNGGGVAFNDPAPSSASAPKETVQWEYQGSQDGAIHGPYSTQNMRDWIQAGYFVGPSAVQVRYIAQRQRAKTAQEDLLNDLESDDEGDDGNDKDAKGSVESVRGDWVQSDHVDFSVYD